MNAGVCLRLVGTIGIVFIAYGCEIGSDKIENSRNILSNRPYSHLTDSIKQFPDNPALYWERAVLLSQNNRHEIATADYKRAWEISGDENIALEYISNLLLVNKVNDAITILKECIKKYPGNTEFSRRLGEVYVQTGKQQDALKQYDQILQTDSMNFETWYDKGMLLMKLKDTSSAIQALETSFNIQPINFTGLALANLYVSTKNPRALEICNILLSNDSSGQQTDPVFMKGVFYSETHQYGKALEQFDECIRRDWKFTDAYLEKGIILYEQRNYAKALEIFNLASTVSNTNADTYFWIGRCYEATGKKEEAIMNYERAIALDRYFPEAMERLKRLKEM